jgi:hypothetical protein
VSEGSHVRWLKVLCRVFLRPLEAAPALLSADELRALFPNLPEVRERHAALLSRLSQLRANSARHPRRLVPLADLAHALLATVGITTTYYSTALSSPSVLLPRTSPNASFGRLL